MAQAKCRNIHKSFRIKSSAQHQVRDGMCPTLVTWFFFSLFIYFFPFLSFISSICPQTFIYLYVQFSTHKHSLALTHTRTHTVNLVEENCHKSETMSPNQSNGQLCRFSRIQCSMKLGIFLQIYYVLYVQCAQFLDVCVYFQLFYFGLSVYGTCCIYAMCTDI